MRLSKRLEATVTEYVEREELNEEQLDEAAGGVQITKVVDKASPNLSASTGGGCPGFEYWFQQLMF